MLKQYNRSTWSFLLMENMLSNLGLFSLYALLSVYFLTILKYSPLLTSYLLLFSALSLRVTRIVFSPLINFFGTKQTFVYSLGLCALGCFLMGLTASPWVIMICLILLGTGYGTNSLLIKVFTAAAMSKSQDTHFMKYAKMSVATNIGAAFGPLIGNYLMLHHPKEWLCFFPAIIFFISAIVAKLSFSKFPETEPTKISIEGIVAHFKIKSLRGPIILTIFGWFLYAQFFTSLPIFVSNGLMRKNLLGVLFFINAAIVILFSVPIGKFAIRILKNEFTIIACSFGLFAIGFFALGSFHYIITAYFAIFIWTVAEILLIPALSALVASGCPKEHHTVGFAMNALAMGIGEGAGNFSGTFLSGFGLRFNAWNITFLSLTIISALFTIVCIIFSTRKESIYV